VGTGLGMPGLTMLSVGGRTTFRLGPEGLSLLQADYGIGSVVGAVFVAASGYAVKKGKIALMMQLVFAICLGFFGLSRKLLSSVIIAFLAGACIVGVISLYSSLEQLMISDSMRGRVMSIF